MANGDNLPYQDLDVIPFTPITSEWGDGIGDDILALAAGTGLDDGAVTPEKRSGGFKVIPIDFGSSTGSYQIDGVGFAPKSAISLSTGEAPSGGVNFAVGFADHATVASTGTTTNLINVSKVSSSTSFIFNSNSSGSNQFSAVISSWDNDGVTLNITNNAGSALYNSYAIIFFG